MPIKFRCQHCRQFLGISRDRAGDIFDCPTCGRTLRVPELDGTVRPLPKPSLDLGDSLLRRALDELADLDQSGGDAIQFEGDSDAQGQSSVSHSTAGESASVEPISVAPQPAPKPIELPPVVPSLKAILPEPVNLAGRSTRHEDDAWKAAIELAEGDSADSPQIEAEPAASPPKVATNEPVAQSVTARTGARVVELNPSFWFAAIGLSAAVFTGGFWAGRLTVAVPQSEVRSVPSHSEESSKPTVTEVTIKPANNVVPGIRGRITYRPENGGTKPDKGARVIALPMDWNGKTKLQVSGFRATDTPDDQRVARASLQAMGGDMAVTDDTGEFSIALKSGGQFMLIVLSGSMPRPEADDVSQATQQLGAYFDRPNQLIGKVMLHIDRVTWSGEGAQPWDHVFQRG